MFFSSFRQVWSHPLQKILSGLGLNSAFLTSSVTIFAGNLNLVSLTMISVPDTETFPLICASCVGRTTWISSFYPQYEKRGHFYNNAWVKKIYSQHEAVILP